MKIAIVLLSLVAAVSFAQTPADDYQISGVVVDHLTNHPLNHVLVQIVSTGKAGGDSSALTEADGRFVFLHVPKGKYQLIAEKRAQNPEAFHSDGGYATAIVVDGKQPTNGIVFAMQTDGSISGTVISDDGEPVRGAQVMLFRESVIEGDAQTITLRGGSTNSEGHFRLWHVEAGKYYVAAQATPWFASPGMETVYPITFYGDTNDGASARPIALAEGGSFDTQITLRAQPAIRVKLIGKTQGLAVFAVGPGGTRVPITSSYVSGDSHFMPLRNRQTPVPDSSQQQHMELTNLAAGRYEVTAAGQGSIGAGTMYKTVELSNGSVLSLDDVPESSIHGTVVFDSPRPGKNVEVFLTGSQRGNMSEVSADGTFQFAKASAGTFGVRLNTPALTVTSLTAKGARIVKDNLEVPPGASVELTVRVTASETLTSIDGFAVRDNSAVPGAMVLLLPQDLGRARLIRRDQADGDGSFTLPAVQPGRYTLVAIDDGKDLAYKDEAVIKPYLAGGLPITIPSKSNEPIKLPVQVRRR